MLENISREKLLPKLLKLTFSVDTMHPLFFFILQQEPVTCKDLDTHYGSSSTFPYCNLIIL